MMASIEKLKIFEFLWALSYFLTVKHFKILSKKNVFWILIPKKLSNESNYSQFVQ